jgi:hypothetical protein
MQVVCAIRSPNRIGGREGTGPRAQEGYEKNKTPCNFMGSCLWLVPGTRLELVPLAGHAPQTCASASSATRANYCLIIIDEAAVCQRSGRGGRKIPAPARKLRFLEVHVTAGIGRCGLLLRDISNQCLGGEQHTGDRRRVLQCRTSHLHRIHDTGLHHVDKLLG